MRAEVDVVGQKWEVKVNIGDVIALQIPIILNGVKVGEFPVLITIKED